MKKTFLTILPIILAPSISLACACGCGVFDVGTAAMLPTGKGGEIFTEYDFMDQNQNWHGTSKASADDNDDKRIRSSFITTGFQYMFNSDWGIRTEIPYVGRRVVTDSDDNVHSSIGDIRIRGIYSGFSPDMSTGITYGLKLPTGDYTYKGFDRDTNIGSGSTNLLLGAYHVGGLTTDRSWNWFINGQLDEPTLTHSGYRPGSEINTAIGTYYDELYIGNVKVTPIAQAIGSTRWHDSGINSDPDNSGYNRVLISPGLETNIGNIKLYGDVELPVYQNVKGNQLVAPELFKLIVSYSF